MVAREEKAVVLDDNTRVQLFAALATLPIIIGGIAWLTALYAKADVAAEKIERQEQRIEAQYLLLQDIRDRVIRIEEKQAHFYKGRKD
jgi:hypothetical protein